MTASWPPSATATTATTADWVPTRTTCRRTSAAATVNLRDAAQLDQRADRQPTRWPGSRTWSAVRATTRITGDANDNVITGGAGNDTIVGGAGNDTFIATVGDGNDSYNGGAGIDTYDLSATTAAALSTWPCTRGRTADRAPTPAPTR